MIKKLQLLLMSAVLATASTTFGDTYNDATGDLGATFSSFSHLDIASVEVTNTATDIAFTFTLVGDIIATNWGKYMIGIDTGAGGDTAGNGWGRPITMNPAGMDYWIGTWVDGTPPNGAEQWTWGGAAWSVTEATYNTAPNNDITMGTTQFTATVTVPLANLGLNIGDTLNFDAYSSGGGATDGAVDALSSSTPSIADWGNAFNSPGDTGLRSYTVVPEPTTFGLIGVGAVAFGLARWRRRK